VSGCSCRYGTGNAERILEDGRLVRFCRGCAAIVEVREPTESETRDRAADKALVAIHKARESGSGADVDAALVAVEFLAAMEDQT